MLVDPNITFFNHKAWEIVRNTLLPIGYYNRNLSFFLYAVLVFFLFFFHFYFLKQGKKIKLRFIVMPIVLLTIVSYPFLSHDFFNYLFDARILTFYHKNPYLFRALDFPHDHWLRFMHWVHRPYPYGPSFLLITIIPSFLSFGKFVLSFLFLKLTYALFYLIAVTTLKKMNHTWAVFYATHPLILIEGLVNAHNDFIGVSLAICGVYFLMKQKTAIQGYMMMVFSTGIKYITAPLLLIPIKSELMSEKTRSTSLIVIFILQIMMVIFFSIKGEMQSWYFLAIFAFLPFFDQLIFRLNLFLAGLLISYYPFIRMGGWDTVEKVQLKHTIIFICVSLNLVYLAFIFLRRKSLIK